eukprot:CAMPEP_0181297758 /NCGR_PEP_ID=MMETSP1101-20121128/5416_1 /TAXON_ID=46948 /ORGANISM="Rhodomonas abbreviata, Strain Caron Lab Isolate" /LENGTH=258 /DNA_ID=CAMNT_0023402727 /DNA_START=964 /DNA_END=1737 /DNA_ORIENTATION=+
MALLGAIATTSCSASEHVLTASNMPAPDFFNANASAGLALWLKPSRTALIHSGAVKRILSPSHFMLGSSASLTASSYLGHSFVIGSATRVITAYTGDANGDGDVEDEGDGEIYLDEPLDAHTLQTVQAATAAAAAAAAEAEATRSTTPQGKLSNSIQYKVFAGYSVHTLRPAGDGEEAELLQWVSAAPRVLLAGRFASSAAVTPVKPAVTDETTGVLTGGETSVTLGTEGSRSDDDAYTGCTLVVGGVQRAIVAYDGE